MNAPALFRPVHHAVMLSAARGIGSGSAPAILQLEGDDFLPEMIDQLRSSEGREALRGQLASSKLFQPIQRRFHVALIDLCCQQPGVPRLDPRRVDSAGLVIRRIRTDASGREYREGWMRLGKRLRGWVRVSQLGEEDADNSSQSLTAADPDPARRLAKLATGSVAIDRALAPVFAARDGALLTEDSTPLHAAPPDVCIDAGRSTWFGLVPTVSSESTPDDPAQALADIGPGTEAFRQHLVDPLRGEQTIYFPLPGERLTAAWAAAINAAGDNDPIVPDYSIPAGEAVWDALQVPAQRHDLQRLLLLLRQLASEFDAFGDSAASLALYARLDAIRLSLPLQSGQTTADTVSAAVFLSNASQILLRGLNDETPATFMPAIWPALAAGIRTALHQALAAALAQRFTGLNLVRGRYDVADARYRLRTFVRLKPEGGCPARIIWSAYSTPFSIARWFESAGAPATRIDLPSFAEARAMKPTVAFAVPPSMQALLSGSAKDLAEGKGSKPPPDDGLGLGWLCSFSLPSITICAFICLNIFLSLFDLIFGWLAFIKICIPYPKPK